MTVSVTADVTPRAHAVVAYRFCRPDDIPLLVRAVNDCYQIHAPGAPEMTVDGFRRAMRDVDLWPSNCMVAMDDSGTRPLAVLLGTKRPAEVSVLAVGVHPGHLRKGHGQHLVTSLSQKLAVLGPERLVADVPADDPAALALFAALGWQREHELVDRLRREPTGSGQPIPEDLVIPVTVAELESAGALLVSPRAPLERSVETIRSRAEGTIGAAVVTPDRVEAFVVAEPVRTADGSLRPAGQPLEVLAAGCVARERASFLLGLLFRWLSHSAERPLRLAKTAPGEFDPEVLASAGFEAGRRWVRFAGKARPL